MLVKPEGIYSFISHTGIFPDIRKQPNISGYNFQRAGLASQRDWRVPDVNELMNDEIGHKSDTPGATTQPVFPPVSAETESSQAGISADSLDRAHRLLEELKTYQIELETQNEELRQTQRQLETSLNKYSDLYDFSPVGYITLNQAGCIQELNLTAARLLDKPRSVLKDKPFSLWLTTTEQYLFTKYLRDVFSADRKLSREFVIWVRNERKVVRLESIVEKDSGHTPLRCFSAIIDMTSSRKIEDKLRESEAFFRQTFDQAPVGVAVLSLDQHFQRVNETFCNITGFSEREMLQRKFSDFVYAGDMSMIKQGMREITEGKVTQFKTTLRYIRKKGDIALAKLSIGSMCDQAGQPLCFIPILEDITEQKHNEDALRDRERQLGLLADALPVLIGYVDTNKLIRFTNASFENWFAAEKGALIGRHIRDVLGSVEYSAVKQHIDAALQGKHANFERRMLFPDKKQRYIQVSHIPNFDDYGYVKGFITLISDISESKLAQDTIRLHEVALAKSSRLSAMGQMAAGIAHELNQPLGALVTYAQSSLRMLAADDFDKAAVARTIEKVSSEARRAGEIVRRLRGYIQKEAPVLHPHNLAGVVQEALTLLETELENSGCSIDISIEAPDCEAVVDPIQIQQVVINLVRNALEAMQEGGTPDPSIAINIRETGPGTTQVCIRDTGPGLSEDYRQWLFTPFHTTKKIGLGLGLNISQTIIERHGGKLELLESSPQGATFAFSLPHYKGHT
jgi:PAS domain S-box-containing protein